MQDMKVSLMRTPPPPLPTKSKRAKNRSSSIFVASMCMHSNDTLMETGLDTSFYLLPWKLCRLCKAFSHAMTLTFVTRVLAWSVSSPQYLSLSDRGEVCMFFFLSHLNLSTIHCTVDLDFLCVFSAVNFHVWILYIYIQPHLYHYVQSCIIILWYPYLSIWPLNYNYMHSVFDLCLQLSLSLVQSWVGG